MAFRKEENLDWTVYASVFPCSKYNKLNYLIGVDDLCDTTTILASRAILTIWGE